MCSDFVSCSTSRFGARFKLKKTTRSHLPSRQKGPAPRRCDEANYGAVAPDGSATLEVHKLARPGGGGGPEELGYGVHVITQLLRQPIVNIFLWIAKSGSLCRMWNPRLPGEVIGKPLRESAWCRLRDSSVGRSASGKTCRANCRLLPCYKYIGSRRPAGRWMIYWRKSAPKWQLSSQCSCFSDTFCIRQHTSAYVSIRQHTSAYVSIRQHASAYVSIPATLATSGYVRIRQDTSANVSKRQQTSANVSIPVVEVCGGNASNILLCVLILLYVSSYYYVSWYYCMCSHTTIYVSLYY